MRRHLCYTVLVLAGLVAGPLMGQNVLLNPSFDEPALLNGDCHGDTQAITNWVGNRSNYRNGDYAIPPCPRNGDAAHLSIQGSGATDPTGLYIAQTVTVTPGQLYTLSGWWFRQAAKSYLACQAELRNGPAQDSPRLAWKQVYRTQGMDVDWLSFYVSGIPTGDTMTVVIRAVSPAGAAEFALHADGLSLVPGNCYTPPAITGITPDHAIRGGTMSGVTITGTNFVAGATSVKLTRPGQPDIVGTSVNVSGTSSLTCNFDLDGAPTGPYTLVVSVSSGDCPPDTLPDAFLIVLPAFANGSFELPTASAGCPASPVGGAPTDWNFRESSGYGFDHGMLRNSDVFPPSCPPPDGLMYASSSSDATIDGANSLIYQTFAVTPNVTYALSGFFAGGGNNTIKLELRDGDEHAPAIPNASATIHTPDVGVYDWTFGTVSGQPTKDYMTAVWQVIVNGTGPHASHADNFAVEICNTPVELLAITPSVGVSDGPITITNLSGNGFLLNGTPMVQLVKGNTRITATDVAIMSGSQISCKFDLTGASSGKYAVMIKQGGCSSVLPITEPGAFQVVAPQFMNGDFESPDAPQNCGPPPAPVGGLPTGWSASGNLIRDGNAPVPPTCPSPANGHYATMASLDTTILKAWQTVRVLPGQSYTFSGWFAGPAETYIRLLDGDEAGTEISSAMVVAAGGTSWVEGSVTGTALTNVMTIVWGVATSSNAAGGHADGLKFASDCNPIWADSDNDGDVDMADFASWQRCVNITGDVPIDPYCRCYDQVPPYGVIDAEFDLPAFIHCMSGPNIPWTTCEP